MAEPADTRATSAPDSGLWSPSAAPALAGGTRLGPYLLVSELGAGGMGRVYLGDVVDSTADLQPGSRVAIKVIHPHLLDNPERVERFRREARAGMAIRHTNVVRTYAVGKAEVGDSAYQYLVMEHVAGQSLRSLLAELGRLPEELCLHIGQEIARGLEAIHAAGLVHRDIKPENVLIAANETVKVADLGVVRVSDATVELSDTGEFLGSIRYAAPEQFMESSHDVDARADLYSLGTVLYELATGQHPFPGRDVHTVVRRVLDESPAPVGKLCEQVSPFLENVLDRLLAKRPAGRFDSAHQLLEVLAAGEAGAWWIDCTRALRIAAGRQPRRIRPPRDARFHGREAEVAWLLERFSEVKRSEGRVVLIEGETGIGKTRLIEELAELLEGSGENLAFLLGAHPPGGGGAFAPYGNAVREFLGEHALADGVRKYLAAAPRLAPGFLSCVRSDGAVAEAESLGRDALATALVRFMQALAGERPTVLVMEDLHFASEEGQALFAALGYEAEAHRLLLIGTVRPGPAPRAFSQLWRHRHCSRLPLPRLDREAVVGLLGDAIQSETVAELLVPRIAAASDGNPYFVLELARQMLEMGVIHRNLKGEWEIEQSIAELDVPRSLHELVAARLGALDPKDRELLEVASCCGQEFDPALVAEAAGGGLLAGLRSLAVIERRDGLVHAIGRRYVFDQHLVQTALNHDLSPPLREAYHAAIGEALEHREQAGERAAPAVPGATVRDLCAHFLQAGLPDRARPYLQSALEFLAGAQLRAAAGELARAALQAPGMIAGRDRIELLLRASIWVGLGSDTQAVLAMINEALALAESNGQAELVGRVLARRANVLMAAGQANDAEADLRRALAIADETGDLELSAEALSSLGTLLRNLGRFEESLAEHEAALARVKDLGLPRELMRCTLSAANTLLDLGREERALRAHEECLGMAREMGESTFEALELGNIGSTLFQLGRFREAKEYQGQHLALARAVGYRRGEMFASVNLGLSARALGHLAEARTCHERALLLARAVGDLMGEAIAFLQLATDDLVLGELDRTQAELDEAAALGDETKASWIIADTLCTKSALLRTWGRLTEAETAVHAGLELFRTMHHAKGVADAKVELGRVLMGKGLPEAAAAVFEEVAPAVGEAAIEHLTAQAHLALLHRLPADPVAAALEHHAERLPRPDLLEAHYLLWKATGAPAQLRAAHRILVELEDHAPSTSRKVLIDRIPMHREIRQALGA